MTQFSHKAMARPVADGRPVNLTIEHGLMGSLMAVAFFGVLALIDSPFSWILIKAFILSVSISSIAAIAVISRNAGVLSPLEEEPTEPAG